MSFHEVALVMEDFMKMNEMDFCILKASLLWNSLEVCDHMAFFSNGLSRNRDR